VFLDPNFLKDAKILVIRVHLRQIYDYLIFARVFRTSWSKMGILGGKIAEWVVRYGPLTNSFFVLGVLRSVPILVKIDQQMRL